MLSLRSYPDPKDFISDWARVTAGLPPVKAAILKYEIGTAEHMMEYHSAEELALGYPKLCKELSEHLTERLGLPFTVTSRILPPKECIEELLDISINLQVVCNDKIVMNWDYWNSSSFRTVIGGYYREDQPLKPHYIAFVSDLVIYDTKSCISMYELIPKDARISIDGTHKAGEQLSKQEYSELINQFGYTSQVLE